MNDGESHLVGDDLGSKPLPITNAADNDANRSNDLALGNNLDKEMLKFKDAVGRKFTFPFNMVNTWQGMEEVIKQAFLQVDVLGPHVQNGHYDIIGPNGDIILPSIWERVVEPGWTVTMAMWPMPKPPLGPLPPRSKPAPRPRAPVPDQVNVPAVNHTSNPNLNSADPSQRPSGSPFAWLPTREASKTTSGGFLGWIKNPGRNRSGAGSQTDSASSSLAEDLEALALERELIVVSKLSRSSDVKPRAGKVERLPVVERLEFSSIRLPFDALATLGHATAELLKPSGSEALKNMAWLHVTRSVMNYNEFRDIAISQFSKSPQAQKTLVSLLATVESRRLGNWCIKPGTVLRCDSSAAKTPDVSAVFISVPTMHPDSIYKTPADKQGTCHGRKLFEAFTSTSVPYHDKHQHFRQNEGARSNQVLWVRQTWILIAGSELFTYSCFPRHVLENDRIYIKDEPDVSGADERLQLIDESRRLYHVKASRCSTFYELQIAARDELLRCGTLDFDDEEDKEVFLRFELQTGLKITAADWPGLLRKGGLPVIKMILAWSYEASDAGAQSDTDDDQRTSSSVGSDRGNPHHTHPTARSKGSRSVSPKAIQGFMVGSQNQLNRAQPSEIPRLHTNMAPFLHWMNPPAGSVDMTARFEDRIAHTEAGLGQTQEQHDDDALDAFHQAFNIDVYKDMAEIDVYDLEARRNNFSRVSISDNRISTFALEYIDLCSQILQAFVPRGCRASLALKYLGGLATTMDVLQRDAFLKGSQNASADKARQPGWVVSRSKLQQLGAKSLGSRRRCRKCEKGAVYHSMEAASAHLHAEHGMGSMLEESIQVFLLPVSAAVDERLKEDCVGTLRQCRDQMISVLKEVKSIQDGLIDADGNITDPAKGIPYSLLDSLRMATAFVCAVPQILEESYDHYMEKVIKRRPISLARSRARAQQKLLSQMGSAIEAGITEAQKLFAASDDTEDQGDARSPPVDVGLPFFTMLIVSNLIMMPTYNHKKAVSLYEAYAKDLSRQYLRDVSRRWTRNITSVVHELSLISEFSTWQQDALSALRLVLHPETRFPVDEFEIEDEFLLWQSKQLENEQDKIRELSKWCSELIQEIDTMTELAGEDQSRSLALLVRIAIALLVLSLAASYMSIAQGDGHALIWQAVALLASSTGVFCFGATNQRLLLDWLNSA